MKTTGNQLNPILLTYIATFVFVLSSVTGFAQELGTKLWELRVTMQGADDEFSWAFLGSPSVAQDGTIYVTATRGEVPFSGPTGHLFALTPSGSKKWQLPFQSRVLSSPAVAPDGTIYLTAEQMCFAIRPDGTVKWKASIDSTTFADAASSPAIGLDGTIYVGSQDRALHAIRPDGTKKWIYQMLGPISSSPAVGADGTIYIPTLDDTFGAADFNRLFAINPDGTKKWDFNTDWNMYSSPALSNDGTVLVTCSDGKLYAIDHASGQKKWEYNTGALIDFEGVILSSPVIGEEDTIYFTALAKVEPLFADYRHKLFAIHSNGTKKWEYLFRSQGGFTYSTPALGADGIIYVASSDGVISAITPAGNKYWETKIEQQVYSNEQVAAPGIAPDSSLYIGTTDGKFISVKSTSKGPANSAWPLHRKNLSRDGRSSRFGNQIAFERNQKLQPREIALSLRCKPGIPYKLESSKDTRSWHFLTNVHTANGILELRLPATEHQQLFRLRVRE